MFSSRHDSTQSMRRSVRNPRKNNVDGLIATRIPNGIENRLQLNEICLFVRSNLWSSFTLSHERVIVLFSQKSRLDASLVAWNNPWIKMSIGKMLPLRTWYQMSHAQSVRDAAASVAPCTCCALHQDWFQKLCDKKRMCRNICNV